MLQNACLLAKIGADTAENERNFAEICQKFATTLRVPPARWPTTSEAAAGASLGADGAARRRARRRPPRSRPRRRPSVGSNSESGRTCSVTLSENTTKRKPRNNDVDVENHMMVYENILNGTQTRLTRAY